MKNIVVIPKDATEIEALIDFLKQHNMLYFMIDDDTRRQLAAKELSNLSNRNPYANATDEEIISAVEESRKELYGTRD